MRASTGGKGPLFAVLAATVIVGLLTGCGGGGDDAIPTPTASAPSDTPSATPAAPGSLGAALLTATDLSADWQPGVSGGTFGPRTTFCGFAPPPELEPQETISGAFSNTKNGFVLAQYLSRYEQGEAARVLLEYRRASEPCDEWNIPARDGSEASYAVSVLEIDGISGGDIFGFKVTMQVDVEVSPIADQAAHLEMHVVLTRFGDLVNWLVYGGLPREELPVEETEDFVRRAAVKLEGFGES